MVPTKTGPHTLSNATAKTAMDAQPNPGNMNSAPDCTDSRNSARYAGPAFSRICSAYGRAARLTPVTMASEATCSQKTR